jgi:predicted transcriptional regulator
MRAIPRRNDMPKTEQQTMLSVRVPSDLLRELEQVAVKEDRSVAAEVRRLIRRHVEAFDNLEGSMVA